MKNTCNDQMIEHERVVAEKEAAMEKLKNPLGKPCIVKMSNEDVFGEMPWAPQMDAKSHDATKLLLTSKCNMCGNLICEERSAAQRGKNFEAPSSHDAMLNTISHA